MSKTTIDSENLETILETLAKEIERLKRDIFMKDLDIKDLKRERDGLLAERKERDGKL